MPDGFAGFGLLGSVADGDAGCIGPIACQSWVEGVKHAMNGADNRQATGGVQGEQRRTGDSECVKDATRPGRALNPDVAGV
jgi:hypothetical protein